ncbi:MAG: hypothetical protein HZB15_18305 [Actinobacteria bacterium]|nr:hypothetical protein [Actinomycetota bacterium]
MTTLLEYATTQFPNHITDDDGGDKVLTDHTAVAHVVGSANAAELVQRVQRVLPKVEVASVMVRPNDATLVPQGGEDPEGVVDLPYRRVAASSIAGGAVVGAIVGVVVGLITGSPMAGFIAGGFGAVLGGMIAAIAGGGARLAGERGWDQPHAPDHTVAVVAAFATSEDEAMEAARVMDEVGPYEVRIVSSDGAWHSPNT